MYDVEYNSTSVLLSRPGGLGLVLNRALATDTKFAVACGGLGDIVIGAALFPEAENIYNHLTPITFMAESSARFSTGPSSKFNTLPELLVNKKTVTVGYNAAVFRIFASRILKNNTVIWIPYKSGADALSSLIDGSLDLYVEGGVLSPLVKSGIIKSLGVFNGPHYLGELDLSNMYPNIVPMHIFLGVYTMDKNDQTIIELHSRLTKLMEQPEFIKALVLAGQKPFVLPLEPSKKLIDNYKATYREDAIGLSK